MGFITFGFCECGQLYLAGFTERRMFDTLFGEEAWAGADDLLQEAKEMLFLGELEKAYAEGQDAFVIAEKTETLTCRNCGAEVHFVEELRREIEETVEFGVWHNN